MRSFQVIIALLLSVFVTSKLVRAEDHLPIVFAKGELAKQRAAAAEFDHSHTIWSKILHEVVVQDGVKSGVKYSALRSSPKELQRYIYSLSDVTKSQFSKFTEAQKLSFLINAYNAFTVTLIINNYPVSSIKKIGGWFSTPWKIQFFKLFGELHSLDDIEHEMIRKWFDEPRIHFALVCAAKSCPPLRNEAYVADRLEDQLHDAAKNFLNDNDRNYFDPATSTLHFSSIFKWYGSDFDKKHGSAQRFAAPFIADSEGQAATIAAESTAIEFLPYDWSLNDAASR